MQVHEVCDVIAGAAHVFCLIVCACIHIRQGSCEARVLSSALLRLPSAYYLCRQASNLQEEYLQNPGQGG